MIKTKITKGRLIKANGKVDFKDWNQDCDGRSFVILRRQAEYAQLFQSEQALANKPLYQTVTCDEAKVLISDIRLMGLRVNAK